MYDFFLPSNAKGDVSQNVDAVLFQTLALNGDQQLSSSKIHLNPSKKIVHTTIYQVFWGHNIDLCEEQTDIQVIS